MECNKQTVVVSIYLQMAAVLSTNPLKRLYALNRNSRIAMQMFDLDVETPIQSTTNTTALLVFFTSNCTDVKPEINHNPCIESIVDKQSFTAQ